MGAFTETGLPEWTDREVTKEDLSSSPVFDLSKGERGRVSKLLEKHSGEEGMDKVMAAYGMG